MNTEIWALVKLRLGLVDDSLQPLIETYIDEIKYRILNYCGINEIPKQLHSVWGSMAIDVIRVELPHILPISITVERGETIKMGDTSTTTSSITGRVTNTSKSVMDEVVVNYKVDLNRYRKLRW